MLGEKPVPVPYYPPQISLTDLASIPAVAGNRQATASMIQGTALLKKTGNPNDTHTHTHTHTHIQLVRRSKHTASRLQKSIRYAIKVLKSNYRPE